jgi:hypothetical protein
MLRGTGCGRIAPISFGLLALTFNSSCLMERRRTQKEPGLISELWGGEREVEVESMPVMLLGAQSCLPKVCDSDAEAR